MTQEWVMGRKLTEIEASNTNAETREKLVETLLNSYMVQFLETGFLHADPHPGNFMLMDDGRLCILDYGMMTTITEQQRIAFVEYIAHLSAKEYDKTLEDLVNLGFVPRALADDPASREIVVPVLAETLETLYGSGGGITAKTDALNAQQSSRVGELSDKLDALSKEYPLQLPPYFVLILRAFGTLEGLGLSVDSNYAIVDECFPYIARRLLSDDAPRMRKALRSFVYGGSDRLKVSRVKDIAGGFSKFTNSMGATEASGMTAGGDSRGELDPATRDALAIVFSSDGNYLQDLVVEEAVRAADSLSRNGTVSVWQALRRASPFASLASLTPLALIPGLNAPILLSLLASQNESAISLTFEDKKNLALLRSVVDLIGPRGVNQSLRSILAKILEASIPRSSPPSPPVSAACRAISAKSLASDSSREAATISQRLINGEIITVNYKRMLPRAQRECSPRRTRAGERLGLLGGLAEDARLVRFFASVLSLFAHTAFPYASLCAFRRDARGGNPLDNRTHVAAGARPGRAPLPRARPTRPLSSSSKTTVPASSCRTSTCSSSRTIHRRASSSSAFPSPRAARNGTREAASSVASVSVAYSRSRAMGTCARRHRHRERASRARATTRRRGRGRCLRARGRDGERRGRGHRRRRRRRGRAKS